MRWYRKAKKNATVHNFKHAGKCKINGRENKRRRVKETARLRHREGKREKRKKNNFSMQWKI